MKRMMGGTKVEPGFYWNTGDWSIVTVEKEPRPLPGGAGQTFVKVPAAGMLLLAPMLGLSFVIFLPFVGFAILARQTARKAVLTAGLVRQKLWSEEAPAGKTGRVSGRKRA
jgi:hypothetical protein